MNRTVKKQYTDQQIFDGLMRNDDFIIRYVFYDHFNDLLYHNANKIAGNKNIDFDDLVQELYLYVSKDNWSKLQKYDSKLPFINWFSVVSYRFFKDFTASMIDSSQDLPISVIDDKLKVIQQEGVTDMIMSDVKNAICEVKPPRDAEILSALLLDEEEPLIVANRYGITVANLYNIKRRALAKLIQKHLYEYNTK